MLLERGVGLTPYPDAIEGVSGGDHTAELWRQHYSDLFNCVRCDPYKISNISD